MVRDPETASGAAATTAAAVGYRLSVPQRELASLADSELARRQACATLLVSRPLDRASLEAALRTLVSRHEILRTVYTTTAGSAAPLMVVTDADDAAFAIETHDVSRLSPPARRAELEAILAGESARVFDLASPPLLRAVLVSLSPARRLLRLTLPAISADAATLRLLASELLALAAGGAPAAEPVQYADYAEWRDELLREDEHAARRAEALVRGREGALPEPVRLPLERFAAVAGDARLAVRRALDETTTSAVRDSAAAIGVPMRAFLFASVEALLARLTPAAEAGIAVLCDGRSGPELAAAAGLFARWLAAGRALDRASTFAELARRAADAIAETCAAEERLPARRRSGAVPFGTVGFSFTEEAELAGARLLDADAHLAPFTLEIEARAGRRLVLSYRSGRGTLDEAALLRIARAHATLLTAAAADPNALARDLALLDPRSRRELLYDLNRTSRALPASTVHELFEEQAARTPDAEAVVCNEERLTYAELNGRANRLARLLRARGVGPDVPVGLCLRPGAAQITALLAILKAGGAYFPLGPENPPARLKLLLEGAGTALVLTDSGLANLFGDGIETLRLDDAAGLLAREPASDLAASAAPENLVYVIATSGSTGVPKPVAVTHANLVNYATAMGGLISELAPGPLRFATVSSLAADLGNTSIFPALLSGGALHVFPHDVATDASLFAEAMREERIDVLKIVPTHLRALLGEPPDRDVLPRRILFLGGEALPKELVELVRALAPELVVANHYGPTETTVGVLVNVLTGPLPETETRTVPIGRPIANTRAYVLDERREPVPAGVAGELWIAGRGVARGYLNMPAPTAESFVPDPFSGEEGARMYRTGDLVRVLDDGRVEFIGRADEQVRLRGHRVELGEIERALGAVPGVARGVAAVFGDRLVAYVAASDGGPSRDALRESLAARLPEHMVPTEVVFLPELPLLASGKVDRRALPEPQAPAEESFTAPRDGVEEALAAIWAEVFAMPRLSVTADFFELGGHSLMATQILSRIKRGMGVALPPSVLFENPTIADLARAVSSAAPASRSGTLRTQDPTPVSARL